MCATVNMVNTQQTRQQTKQAVSAGSDTLPLVLARSGKIFMEPSSIFRGKNNIITSEHSHHNTLAGHKHSIQTNTVTICRSVIKVQASLQTREVAWNRTTVCRPLPLKASVWRALHRPNDLPLCSQYGGLTTGDTARGTRTHTQTHT